MQGPSTKMAFTTAGNNSNNLGNHLIPRFSVTERVQVRNIHGFPQDMQRNLSLWLAEPIGYLDALAHPCSLAM